LRTAQIFVAVLGASNYTYAEATWTQTLPDWIGAQVRALSFLGGCPDIIVPDNLKSAASLCPPLRTGSESDLPGFRRPLRAGGDPGTGAQASG
jgi:transposase